MARLNNIELTSIPVTAAENDVFKGEGYLLKFIQEHCPQTLVLATEIKKIYCDELSGELYPLITENLANQFKKANLY